MQIRNIIHTVFALSLAACGPEGFDTYTPDADSFALVADFEGEGEGEEAGGAWGGEEPDPITAEVVLPDMPEEPDTDPAPEPALGGYCCDCDIQVAPGVSCWPSAAVDCPVAAMWCELDNGPDCTVAVCGG